MSIYERLINAKDSPDLTAFLKERPEMLDATSHPIYRAKALGLLRALLSSPDGAKHLADYCSNHHLIQSTVLSCWRNFHLLSTIQ